MIVRVIAEQNVRTAAWVILDESGARIGSVRHRFQVESSAKSIARVLAPGAEVRITYRPAFRRSAKRARES